MSTPPEIWLEPRNYGYAAYAMCPVCGDEVRLAGYEADLSYREAFAAAERSFPTGESVQAICACSRKEAGDHHGAGWVKPHG